MTDALAGVRAEVVEQAGCRRTLAISVTAEAVRAELDDALERAARALKLPGFRKGRAPLSVVRRRQGAAAQTEALQRVMEAAYRTALEDGAIRPVSEGEIEQVEYEPGAGLSFRISFEVEPVVALSRLDGFTVERPAAAVHASAVDEMLERLREEHAIWRPPDVDGMPGSGDLVTVRIVRPDGRAAEPAEVGLLWARRLKLRLGTEHRGRYQFVLGEGDAVPELEAAIRGLSVGDTADCTVRLPEGREAALRVTLEDRQVKELPELDDLWAQSLGEFDGLASLRLKLEADLLEEMASRAEAVLRARLLDAVVDANPFDLPASLVAEQMRSALAEAGGSEAADARGRDADLPAEAERAVRRRLVLDRIAEMFQLQATEEEIEARLADIARSGQVTADQVRARLVATGRLDRLVAHITNAKVYEFLKRRCRIIEQPLEGP